MSGDNNEIRISLTLDGKQYVATLNKATSETAKFVGSTQKLSKATKETEKPVKHLTGSVDDLNQRLLAARKTFNGLSPSAKNYGNSLKRVTALQNNLRKATQHTTGNMAKFGAASGKTGFAVLNMNRVISDSPFGMIAISNNIEPLVQSFMSLKATAGGTKGAFKTLATSMMGPLGIMTAVSLVTAGMTYLALGAQGTKNAIDELTLEKLLDELSDFDKALKKIKEDVHEIPVDELGAKLERLNSNLDKTVAKLGEAFNLSALFTIGGQAGGMLSKIFGTDADIDDYTKKIIAFYTAINEIKKAKDTPGIIGQLRVKLKGLEDDLGKATTEKSIRGINVAIKETRTELDRLLGKTAKPPKMEFLDGSIGALKEEIKKLGTELEATTSDDSRIKLRATIETKGLELDKLEGKEIDVSLKLRGKQLDVFNQIKKEFTSKGFEFSPGLQAFTLNLAMEFDPQSIEKTKKELETKFSRKAIAHTLGLAVDKNGLLIPLKMKFKKEEVKLTKKEMSDLNFQADILQSSFGRVGDAMVDAMVGAKISVGELVTEIGVLIAKMLVMEAIKFGITAAFPQLGIGSGAITSIFGGGKADGGPVDRNKMYLTGERGMELFIPSSSGRIMSNPELNSMNRQTANNMRYLSHTGRSGGNSQTSQPTILMAESRITKRGLVTKLKQLENSNNRMLRTYSAA